MKHTPTTATGLVGELEQRYPNISFEPDQTFMWSPSENTIYYDPERIQSPQGSWSLLHELGHALARHEAYTTDLALIKLERQAWRFARQVGSSLQIEIDENHIQDCLDSYRDWLHQRSRCPECSQVNPQHTAKLYECFNCRTKWRVSASQLCSSRSRAS